MRHTKIEVEHTYPLKKRKGLYANLLLVVKSKIMGDYFFFLHNLVLKSLNFMSMYNFYKQKNQKNQFDLKKIFCQWPIITRREAR